MAPCLFFCFKFLFYSLLQGILSTKVTAMSCDRGQCKFQMLSRLLLTSVITARAFLLISSVAICMNKG